VVWFLIIKQGSAVKDILTMELFYNFLVCVVLESVACYLDVMYKSVMRTYLKAFIDT
jgi:hypothetical protein